MIFRSMDKENYRFYKKLTRNDVVDFLKDINGVIF